MSVPRPAMFVAIVTPPLRPGLGDDLRLPLVVLGVQDTVLDSLAHQVAGQTLRLLDGDGSDQRRLAPLMALFDVLDDRVELFFLGAIHDIREILPDDGPVCGRHDTSRL